MLLQLDLTMPDEFENSSHTDIESQDSDDDMLESKESEHNVEEDLHSEDDTLSAETGDHFEVGDESSSFKETEEFDEESADLHGAAEVDNAGESDNAEESLESGDLESDDDLESEEEIESASEAEVEVEEEEEKQPDNKNWYVVKVQSGREESIKASIERRVKIEGLEEFYGQIVVPVEKETILSKGKRITRERKKFPGYIMAEVEYNDQILYLFRETSGVGDFVGGGPNHPPIPMTDTEIKRMLGPQADEAEKPAEIHAEIPFAVGDRVQVKDGVFSGMEGEVKELLPSKGKLRVELFVLGRPVSMELEHWQVEGV